MTAQVFTPISWQPIRDNYSNGVNGDRWYFHYDHGELWQRVAEGKRRD